ncbi:PRLI-interacting factor [Artemisia annua]|uniref:PRLI-interacting factor n=1 Tax=Artemisia annua TaxID=35608 RepID=A0A2U1MH59_ARTAN|nr:PRLI-interacting factor [Artemisia annua]
MNDQKQQQMMNMNMSQQLPPVNQFVVNHPIMSNNNRGGYGIAFSGSGSGSNVYNPPTLNELQQQNRVKARRYFGKKKAKKAGGITSLVSPCPVTPAVLPTPIFSPSREVLVDMAKEEWGVDGYGSMKGLIRLRSNEGDVNEEDEEEEGGSSESDVEEHVEVERRLDHDLSRFEMIYPNYGVDHSSYNLENRVDDQDTHIAQLEEENLILKERMFLMEREFDDLRMRLQRLERQSRGGERLNEEVVENDSENDSESRGYGRSIEDNNEVMEENNEQSEDNNDGVNADIKQSDSMGKGIQETEAGTKVANNEVMEENNQQFEGNNGDDADVKQSDSVEKGLQAMEAGINVANNVEETKGLDVGTDVCMEETESVKENDDGAALVDKSAEVSVGGDGSTKDEEKV